MIENKNVLEANGSFYDGSFNNGEMMRWQREASYVYIGLDKYEFENLKITYGSKIQYIEFDFIPYDEMNPLSNCGVIIRSFLTKDNKLKMIVAMDSSHLEMLKKLGGLK